MNCASCGASNQRGRASSARSVEDPSVVNARPAGRAVQPVRNSAKSAGRLSAVRPSRKQANATLARTRRSTSPRRSSPRARALEGERKQVTVLFADVKGSMDLAEQFDPEEWHGSWIASSRSWPKAFIASRARSTSTRGDGIMALFGAPIAHEDHAQRACYAALHLQDELRRYATSFASRTGLNFSVRMGLNSGEVVVGKIGDDLRMDYTAQGHTVGLAAGWSRSPSRGRSISPSTRRKLVEGLFQLRTSDELDGQGSAANRSGLRARGRRQTAHPPRRFTGTRLLEVRRPRATRWLLWTTRSSGRSREMRRSSGSSPSPESARAGSASSSSSAAGRGDLASSRRTACRTGRRSPCCRCSSSFATSSASRTRTRDEAAREKIAGRLVPLDESATRVSSAGL